MVRLMFDFKSGGDKSPLFFLQKTIANQNIIVTIVITNINN